MLGIGSTAACRPCLHGVNCLAGRQTVNSHVNTCLTARCEKCRAGKDDGAVRTGVQRGSLDGVDKAGPLRARELRGEGSGGVSQASRVIWNRDSGVVFF